MPLAGIMAGMRPSKPAKPNRTHATEHAPRMAVETVEARNNRKAPSWNAVPHDRRISTAKRRHDAELQAQDNA